MDFSLLDEQQQPQCLHMRRSVNAAEVPPATPRPFIPQICRRQLARQRHLVVSAAPENGHHGPQRMNWNSWSISWVTATPADVVKSRMQADAQLQRQYKGILHCIIHSYKTEGIQVFFRGASVNAIRGFPMSATMFLTYELSLQFFRSL
ncbi:solute carrier family 25 member 48-like protein [Lates japonicus]|uniref:Solute carrier family 25 member 48-like protein n=1 Tax=Lates japonicus TaxID=270547 RepID=A0AAD3RGU3_LATJO|nr:solute carrier family 25 member 48-like protein [Lates japonicus]